MLTIAQRATVKVGHGSQSREVVQHLRDDARVRVRDKVVVFSDHLILTASYRTLRRPYQTQF